MLHLAELTDDDPEHSARSADLALELFDQLAAWHGLDDGRPRAPRGGGPALQRGPVHLPLGPPQAQLLRDPELRAPDRLHRRRDRGHRPGRPLPPQERRPRPSTRRSPRLDEADQRWCATLAGILRVAIGLDRAHRGSVGALRCVKDEDGLVDRGRARRRRRHHRGGLVGRRAQGPAGRGARTGPSRCGQRKASAGPDGPAGRRPGRRPPAPATKRLGLDDTAPVVDRRRVHGGAGDGGGQLGLTGRRDDPVRLGQRPPRWARRRRRSRRGTRSAPMAWPASSTMRGSPASNCPRAQSDRPGRRPITRRAARRRAGLGERPRAAAAMAPRAANPPAAARLPPEVAGRGAQHEAARPGRGGGARRAGRSSPPIE